MLAVEWATVTILSGFTALPYFNRDVDRRVERAMDDGERILRETQRSEYRAGQAETDTLEVSVARFASRRVLRRFQWRDDDRGLRLRCVPG